MRLLVHRCEEVSESDSLARRTHEHFLSQNMTPLEGTIPRRWVALLSPMTNA